MLTVISRILHYGFANFWRNALPSATTVAIMVLALMVFIGLVFTNVVTGKAVEFLQNKIDISVYFNPNVPEDEILSVKQGLEALSEVKSVEYISADEALEIFKAKHADDQDWLQALEELNQNPLIASLNIKANRADQFASIAQYLDTPALKEKFSRVTYFENKAVIDNLVGGINVINKGGLVLSVILTLVAGLMVFNTIHLAIYSNREEITIMRAVGASNALVRGPYMVEGVIAGAIAAIISLFIALPLAYTASPHLSLIIEDFNLFQYFYTHLFTLLGYQLIFGVGIGALSSLIAVRRYLRN